jgi:retron-type reverse transcriptase
VHNFHWLNSANNALLPKKEGAEEISDYRPISLILAIAKIVSKMLANWLGPLMDRLVSNAQNAFIKRRSIHDNFLYVKNLATRFHKNKTPALLLKIDIRKAFDSIRWEYLLTFSNVGVSHHVSGIRTLPYSPPLRPMCSSINGIAGAPIS